jgi:hypothetical protein
VIPFLFRYKYSPAAMYVCSVMSAAEDCVYVVECTDVSNCNSCANPGPECVDCPDATVLNADRDNCLGKYAIFIRLKTGILYDGLMNGDITSSERSE